MYILILNSLVNISPALFKESRAAADPLSPKGSLAQGVACAEGYGKNKLYLRGFKESYKYYIFSKQ